MIADPHDIRKSTIEDEMIADAEDRDALAKAAYEAFWNHWVKKGLASVSPWELFASSDYKQAWYAVSAAVVKKLKENESAS